MPISTFIRHHAVANQYSLPHRCTSRPELEEFANNSPIGYGSSSLDVDYPSGRSPPEPFRSFDPTTSNQPTPSSRFNRSYSTRLYSSSNSAERRPKEKQQTRRTLQRQRPSTLHIRKPIPTVNVRDFDPTEIEETKDNFRKMSREIAEKLQRLQDPHQELIQKIKQSRSVSPQPRSSEISRKDSMMTILNRIWKSDECNQRPPVQKMANLEIPRELTRQLSLSDTNVTPSPSAAPSRRPSIFGFSPKQKRLLKASFNQLNSGGTFLKIMEQVFRRLETKCPDIRSIFLTTTFINSLSRERSSPPLVKTEYDHCKCLVGVFERLMDHLDDIESQLPIIRSYGEKHAHMHESGFDGAMIEHFGEVAVSIIGSQDSIKFNHDAVKAWRLLLAYITDEMKVGYERIRKINQRRNSSYGGGCPVAH